jgi:hypothetical protein
LASKAKVTETPAKAAARTRRQRRGEPGRAVVPRKGTVGGGRAKGQTNLVTKAAKEALELAFQGVGGVPALIKWGKDNKTEFYKIWARLIPKDVSVNPGVGLEEMLQRLSTGRDDTVPGEYLEVENK